MTAGGKIDQNNITAADTPAEAERLYEVDKKDRNVENGLRDIRRLRTSLELGRVVHEEAARYLHAASQADVLVGGGVSLEAFAAACTYAAGYAHHSPRTYDEVADVTGPDCEVRDIRDAHRRLKQSDEVPLRCPSSDDWEWPRYEPHPRDLVPRFTASVVGEVASPPSETATERAQLEQTARAWLGHVLENTTSAANRAAKALAAAAVYVAGQEVSVTVTYAEVADATLVSEHTLGQAVRDLRGTSGENREPLT